MSSLSRTFIWQPKVSRKMVFGDESGIEVYFNISEGWGGAERKEKKEKKYF